MHVIVLGVQVYRRVIVVDVRRRKVSYLSSAPVTTQISSNSSEASCGFGRKLMYLEIHIIGALTGVCFFVFVIDTGSTGSQGPGVTNLNG